MEVKIIRLLLITKYYNYHYGLSSTHVDQSEIRNVKLSIDSFREVPCLLVREERRLEDGNI